MNEKSVAVALSQARGAGPVLLKRIQQQFGTASAAWSCPRDEWLDRGFSQASYALFGHEGQLKSAERLLELHQSQGIEVVTLFDSSYPMRLAQIPDPPPVLFIRGNINFDQRMVGVVGTRRMTRYGRLFLEQIIPQMKTLDACTVSGLAYGVDGLAHRLSVQMGIPTVGVLAHGLDRIYPSAHHHLAQSMMKQGGLISEFPNGTKVHPALFIRRNRILAGLVDVLVVVESAIKGGALITAGFANEYDREVLALPGAVDAPFSKGCHLLIKEHRAHLLEEVDDLVRLMNWSRRKREVDIRLEESELEVMRVLDNGPLHFDVLSGRLQIPPSKLSGLLLKLELKKCISSLPGNLYKRL